MKDLLKQLQQLATLAEAATAGPWCAAGRPTMLQKVCGSTLEIQIAEYVARENAAFIAAARNLLTPENLQIIRACVKVVSDSQPILNPANQP